MDASVLIPTYGRAAKLAACVASLLNQRTTARFEVVIGVDGGLEDPARLARAAAEGAWNAAAAGTGRELRIIDCPREGYTLVRNRLVEAARGEWMVSLNDDVVCEPGFLESHLRAHAERAEHGKGPAIVVGDSPYIQRPRESLLDRLVRRTPMVFFYDVMNTPQAHADRERDWGFRHCFGLNFSARLSAVREVGGFFARPHLYGYDDIELGFRLTRRFAMPVLFRPEARLWHDHHYEPAQILERERKLGESAWLFAGANPDFALACFGRDIRSAQELAYSREFVQRERPAAERVRDTFMAFGAIAADAIPDGPGHDLLTALYQQHLLLKRWEWRTGLLAGSQREGM